MLTCRLTNILSSNLQEIQSPGLLCLTFPSLGCTGSSSKLPISFLSLRLQTPWMTEFLFWSRINSVIPELANDLIMILGFDQVPQAL